VNRKREKKKNKIQLRKELNFKEFCIKVAEIICLKLTFFYHLPSSTSNYLLICRDGTAGCSKIRKDRTQSVNVLLDNDHSRRYSGYRDGADDPSG